jgi:hypothetical protein
MTTARRRDRRVKLSFALLQDFVPGADDHVFTVARIFSSSGLCTWVGNSFLWICRMEFTVGLLEDFVPVWKEFIPSFADFFAEFFFSIGEYH